MTNFLLNKGSLKYYDSQLGDNNKLSIINNIIYIITDN